MPNHSVMESSYVSSSIETARVVDVNIQNWTVDLVSEYGNKRFLDVQIMSPYFHYVNGEGIYVMPEVGSLVWVCRPSSGRFATPFVLGFQAPYEESSAGYQAGRQSLNPGDIMLRTRDENFIVLRRGGVIQIGATPITQRMYLPIQNFIKDFCENYALTTMGGSLEWLTDRDDQSIDGDRPTTFHLNAKSKANEPAHVATLTVGSHGEDSPTTLELTVFDSGNVGAAAKARLQITKEGDVTWWLDRRWELRARQEVVIESQEEAVTVSAPQGEVGLSGVQVAVTADDAFNVQCAQSTEDVAGTKMISAENIKLGGPAAVQQAVLGTELVTFLSELLTAISGIPQTSPAVAMAPLATKLAKLLSQKVFVE